MNTLTDCHNDSALRGMNLGRVARGFTLVELMVVVAIIGIISSIALPAYTDYVKKGKAAEATATLADMRVKMEQYFQDNRTYNGADALNPGPCNPVAGTTKYFTYACANLTDTTYDITATGNASENMSGFAYSVDELNAKTSTYDGYSANCWLNKKSTSC